MRRRRGGGVGMRHRMRRAPHSSTTSPSGLSGMTETDRFGVRSNKHKQTNLPKGTQTNAHETNRHETNEDKRKRPPTRRKDPITLTGSHARVDRHRATMPQPEPRTARSSQPERLAQTKSRACSSEWAIFGGAQRRHFYTSAHTS
eukprot:384493-Prymnesium_polylepis.1